MGSSCFFFYCTIILHRSLKVNIYWHLVVRFSTEMCSKLRNHKTYTLKACVRKNIFNKIGMHLYN